MRQYAGYLGTRARKLNSAPVIASRLALLRRGLELIFLCHREGHVDLDALSERARTNYLRRSTR